MCAKINLQKFFPKENFPLYGIQHINIISGGTSFHKRSGVSTFHKCSEVSMGFKYLPNLTFLHKLYVMQINTEQIVNITISMNLTKLNF